MKILHCCLANFYIDDFGYQENILPKIHKLQGHDVMIVASTETYIDKSRLGFTSSKVYKTSEGIPIIRLPYQHWLPRRLMSKLRFYQGLKGVLNSFKPEVIFLHDCQFFSIKEIKDYKKKNPEVKLFVDCHTDLINSARSWISKHVLHKILYKRCAKMIEPYTAKFYGTLPLRNEFLKDIYNIASQKIDLLPFGADDTLFKWDDRVVIRERMRKQLAIDNNDFIIISGGKIDKRKNIHKLISAFSSIKSDELNRPTKLIIFGKPIPELLDKFNAFYKLSNILFIDWINATELYKYFFASDLTCFPGTHSVLWEESIGCGLPGIFLRWKGIEHIDVGGNCNFIHDGEDETEIKEAIIAIVNDSARYKEMLDCSLEKGKLFFSYFEIAKRALGN